MTVDAPILVADIGGTNARFAIARTGGRISLEQVQILATRDYDSLQAAALAYLGQTTGPRPTLASIAIAGPVVGDYIRMTNCPWAFSRESLTAALGMTRVILLNDFEAIASALPYLDADNLLNIGQVSADMQAGGTKLVIGPGTGIGVAAITPVGDGWKVLTSEGGHVGFAPADDLERQILRTVKYKYPRVSVERVISGQGFSTLHQALAALRGEEVEKLTPSEITRRALRDPGSHCGQVVDIFCSILGTFAGDMAVTFNATGGVYLAGGILPKIQDFFLDSQFRARFEDKGRLHYVKTIPTVQIMEKQPALIGAAARTQGKFY